MSLNNSRVIFLLTFAVLMSPLATAFAQTPMASPVASPVVDEPTFREAECMYDLPTGVTADDVQCGWVTAPMYPDADKPGVVELPIIRFKATTDSPAAEPLLILLGGPGQNMSAVLPLFGDDYPIWEFMLERQDVILFDQRGFGLSVPTLACPFERVTGDSGAPEGNTNTGFALMQCGAHLQQEGTDLSAFNTKNNGADIEAIRVAMGFDQVDLYGISYGSKLALSAIRDYPDSIRSTIIASPFPQESNPFSTQTIGFDSALNQLWADCAADAGCAAANPDPAGDMIKSVELLNANPLTVQVPIPGMDEPVELPIDGYQFMQLLYLGVFIGPIAPSLPYLATTVAAGDDSVLQTLAPYMATSGGLSMGGLFTYFCQDEVPFSPKSETDQAVAEADLAAPIADGTYVGLGEQSYLICRAWNLEPASDIEGEAVVSDKPILILTGTYDPITPPSNGEAVASNFPNSQLVEFVAQGHDPASSDPECSTPMITSFLNAPTAAVDASCAAEPIVFPTLEELLQPQGTPVASPVPGL